MEYDSFLKNKEEKLKGASNSDFTDFINNSSNVYTELDGALTSLNTSLEDPNLWNDDVKESFGSNMETITQSITAGKTFCESVATPVSTKIDPLNESLKSYIEAVDDYNTLETEYKNINVGSEPVKGENQTDAEFKRVHDAWASKNSSKESKKNEMNTKATEVTTTMLSCYSQINAINATLGSTADAAVPEGLVNGLISTTRTETMSDGSLKNITEWRDMEGNLVKEEYEVVNTDNQTVESGTIEYYKNGNKSRWQYNKTYTDDPTLEQETGVVIEYNSDGVMISRTAEEVKCKNGDIYTGVNESYDEQGQHLQTTIETLEEGKSGDVYKNITITKDEEGNDAKYIEEINRKVSNSTEYNVSEKSRDGVLRERYTEKVVSASGVEESTISEYYDEEGNISKRSIGMKVDGEVTHYGIDTTYENGEEKTRTDRIVYPDKTEHGVTTGYFVNEEDDKTYSYREMEWVERTNGDVTFTQDGVREVYTEDDTLVSRHCDKMYYDEEHASYGYYENVDQEYYEDGTMKTQTAGTFQNGTTTCTNMTNHYDETGKIIASDMDERVENGITSKGVSIEYDENSNEKQEWIKSVEYSDGTTENDVVVFYENGEQVERVVGNGFSVEDVDDDELIIEEFEEPATPKSAINYETDPRFQAQNKDDSTPTTSTSGTQSTTAGTSSQPAAAPVKDGMTDINAEYEKVKDMPYTEEGQKEAMISYIERTYGDSLPAGMTSEDMYNRWANNPDSAMNAKTNPTATNDATSGGATTNGTTTQQQTTAMPTDSATSADMAKREQMEARQATAGTTSTPASTTAESQTTDAAPKSAINYETDPKFQAPKEQTADTATAAVAATTGVVDTQVSSGGAVATESTPTTTGAAGTQTTETTTNGTPTQQTTQAAATPAVKQTDRYKTVEGTTYNNGKFTSSVVEDASGKKYIKTEELGKMPKYTEITEDDFATIQQAQQQRAQQASAPSGDGTVLTNAKPNVIE